MFDKKKLQAALKLYAVTDNAWLDGRTLGQCVAEALAGGATFVQLRDKHAEGDVLAAEAAELLALCRAAGVPFVVNDDVECARAVGADGVHVGQDDMACERARALLEKAQHQTREALADVRRSVSSLREAPALPEVLASLAEPVAVQPQLARALVEQGVRELPDEPVHPGGAGTPPPRSPAAISSRWSASRVRTSAIRRTAVVSCIGGNSTEVTSTPTAAPSSVSPA